MPQNHFVFYLLLIFIVLNKFQENCVRELSKNVYISITIKIFKDL